MSVDTLIRDAIGMVSQNAFADLHVGRALKAAKRVLGDTRPSSNETSLKLSDVIKKEENAYDSAKKKLEDLIDSTLGETTIGRARR